MKVKRKKIRPQKQQTFCDVTTGFPAKSEKRAQKNSLLTMTRHSTKNWVVFLICGSQFSGNLKHYQDLGIAIRNQYGISELVY